MVDQSYILVVDDDPDIRWALQLALSSNGFRVREARHADEALEVMGEEMPDCIVLDVMMRTEIEGFNLARELKSRPETSEVPIIILTSFLDKVRNEGPDKFIDIVGQEWPATWLFEKPVNNKKLIAKIKSAVQGNQKDFSGT